MTETRDDSQLKVAAEAHARGMDLLKRADYEGALAAFFEAVGRDPTHWESWLALAEWKLRIEDLQSCHEFLERALDSAPVVQKARIQARIEMLRARGKI